MTYALVAIFILTYALIAFEEPLRINKSGTALAGAGILWAVLALGLGDSAKVDSDLSESLIGTAQIAFFLIGAMTIVEVIDAHDGFEVVTARLSATRLSSLVWIIGTVTFFLSAVLDNLTTTIVMVSLLRKLLNLKDDRLWLSGAVIIAANAGGAWSPIGDVTTTMLWIGGQVSAGAIVVKLIVPSLVNAAVPLAIIAYIVRGRPVIAPPSDPSLTVSTTTAFERNTMFALGLAALLAVPLFKAVTHLPPFLGVLTGLGIVWIIGDLIHRDKQAPARERVTIAHALTRIDMSAIVFFIGILLAVATLEHVGVLRGLAQILDAAVGRLDVIVMLLGLLSAVIDNVPMVAAAMGMYDLGTYPPDSFLWEFLAYCAGTGGSILVIGSAAGVAAMGIERIGFLWYARRIGPLALAGYFAGAGVYLLQSYFAG